MLPARVRPPGEHVSYSNYGASLAGYIIERVSGLSWADYVDENILKPLQMNSTNTQSSLVADFSERHATGYKYRAGRFIATPFWFGHGAPDRFIARYTDSTMVFERNESGKVSHVLIGWPFDTYKRVTGLDAPGNIRMLMAFAVMIALLAVIGYSYRVFGRAPVEKRLPARDVFIGWLYALALVGLNAHLVLTLTGNTNEFVYGVPPAVHINLLLINVNMLIGVAVIFLSIRQWVTGIGSLNARLRYSALSMAAIVYLWIAYYFNFFAYLFA